MAQDDSEDDFGMSSSDELELQAMADNADKNATGHRKHARNESTDGREPLAKASKFDSALLDVATDVMNKKFKLPVFRLKQALAIERLLSEKSAVVVFPTGGGKSLTVHF